MSEIKAGETGQKQVPVGVGRLLLGTAPPWACDFSNLSFEWRRVVAEVGGTFFLVIVGAGAGVVNAVYAGQIGRAAAVVVPGLMVMAIILAVGAISGAHLNPIVSVAFALRREFPWRRIPLYVAAQVLGGVLACLFLWAMFGKVGHLGATLPGPHTTDVQAMFMEAALTFGLVSVILGTASGAQNAGPLSAIAVGGYIALAGLWSSPVSGASMNPVRSFSPAVVLPDFSHFWVYLAGPSIGMLFAVGLAHVLRGPGPDPIAIQAAEGSLGLVVVDRRHANDRPPPGPNDQEASAK